MINITGQVLPIKKICDMAHSYGVEVMVDGAHCVGHFDFSIDDFNCDYYGSSLHKWLATPLGAGLLYVNKNKTHIIDITCYYITHSQQLLQCNASTKYTHTHFGIRTKKEKATSPSPLRGRR